MENGARFENSHPILRVEDMESSLRFYVNGLGFTNASWGSEFFTCISRDKAMVYLCKGIKAGARRGFGLAWKT